MSLSIYKMDIIIVCFTVILQSYCEKNMTTVKVLSINIYFYTIWKGFISWIGQTTWYLGLWHSSVFCGNLHSECNITEYSPRSRGCQKIYTQFPKYSIWHFDHKWWYLGAFIDKWSFSEQKSFSCRQLNSTWC